MQGNAVQDQDLDLGGRRVYNPAAPVGNTDIVRLQDITTVAADINGFFVVTKGTPSFPNATNLGGMGSGFVKSTVSGGISTLSIDTSTYLTTTAAASTYQPLLTAASGANLTPKFIVQQPASGLPNAQAISALGTGLLKGTTTTGVISIGVANTDFADPAAWFIVTRAASAPANATNLGGLASGFVKSTVSGGVSTVSIDTSTYQPLLTSASGASLTSKFIVQGTTDGGLTNAQFLGALATGLLWNTTTTGVLRAAVANTDFATPLNHYVITQSDAGLSNATNLGGLSSGMLQQTVTGAAATVATLNMTQGAIPFGAANGTLTQSPTILFWDDGNQRLGIRTNTPAAQLHLLDQSAAADRGMLLGGHGTAAQLITFKRSEGTLSSPTTVANTDYLGVVQQFAYDGTSYLQTGEMGFRATPASTITTGVVPTDWYVDARSASATGPYEGAGHKLGLRLTNNRLLVNINPVTTTPTNGQLVIGVFSGSLLSNGPSAIDIVENVAGTSGYMSFRWFHGGSLSPSNKFMVSQSGGGQTNWWKGNAVSGSPSTYLFDESSGDTSGSHVSLLAIGGLGAIIGDTTALGLYGSTNGTLEITSKTGLTTQTAIAMTSAFRQDVLKSGGTIGLGTSDANPVLIETNSTTRITLGATGSITLNALPTAGFVKTSSAGLLSIDTTTYLAGGSVGPGAGTYGGGSVFVNSVTLDVNGRVTAVATGTPPASGADALGWYIVTKAANAPADATNLGGLGTGLVKSTVSGGVSTISIDASAYLTQAYSTVAAAGTARTQRATLNFSTNFTAVDNSGAARTDVDLSTTGVAANTYSFATITVDTFGRITSAATGSVAGSSAFYVVNQSASAPPNAINLGALGSGFIKSSVSGGVATLSADNSTYLTTTAAAATYVSQAYVLVKANGTSITQRSTLNFSTDFTPVDNVGSTRTDVALSLTGVGAGTYNSVTVSPAGRVTAGTNVSIPSAAAFYVVTQSASAPGNAVNLGGMSSGLLKQTVSGGIATLANAVAGTDFQAPITASLYSVLFAQPANVVNQDNNNFVYDGSNGRLILRKGGTYTGAAGAPLTISGATSAVAIALDGSTSQGIIKTNAAFNIGTGDSHALQFVVNNSIAAFFDTGNNLLPNTNNSYNLGAAGNGWATLYANQIAAQAGDLYVTTVSASGNVILNAGNYVKLAGDGTLAGKGGYVNAVGASGIATGNAGPGGLDVVLFGWWHLLSPSGIDLYAPLYHSVT